MASIEKTVFISYRRTNFAWAQAIFQNLKNEYDVFLDYERLRSGDFERAIFENISSRAHFLVLLTPSALERCVDPTDLFCREIERALETQRNVVPLMIEGFDFSTPAIANQLTGGLVTLKKYNALSVPPEYFENAMEKLRDRFLNVPLDTVLHPASLFAQQTAIKQKAAAETAPTVKDEALVAEQWFERGFIATDDKVRLYDEAIRLNPDFAEAIVLRGIARSGTGDVEGALRDFNEAIRLNKDSDSVTVAYLNRCNVNLTKRNFVAALKDYDEVVRHRPDFAQEFNVSWRRRLSIRAIRFFAFVQRLIS